MSELFVELFSEEIPAKLQINARNELKKNIKNFFIDINNSWLNPDKVRRLTIITNKKMLLFNEMESDNKIKIFNKYAQYPKISYFDNKFFNRKAKIYLGKNFSPKVKQNDSLYDEINYFFNCIKKNKKPITDISFALKILKTLKKIV